jgi:hypothetical protein
VTLRRRNRKLRARLRAYTIGTDAGRIAAWLESIIPYQKKEE